jgi:DNA-binding Lrp family transcriptional regulator
MGVFDELETIGAHRIVGADDRRRRVVRKWTHGGLSLDIDTQSFRHIGCKVHAKTPLMEHNSARFVHHMELLRMIPVDAFDLKMLAALQDDGRLTNQQLADRVGLSASQCSRRRMRLEEEKVIAGYHADLASEALGFNLIAFIHITLATHSPDNAKKFRALVTRVDAIQEAYSLTGDADYLLKAVLRDLKSLSDIVNNVLMPHQSVAHVRSSIVLDRLKESSKLPLKELAR